VNGSGLGILAVRLELNSQELSGAIRVSLLVIRSQCELVTIYRQADV